MLGMPRIDIEFEFDMVFEKGYSENRGCRESVYFLNVLFQK